MFPPTRIVCLTEETVETLYLLGEQDRIVGISGYVVAHSRLVMRSRAWMPSPSANLENGCCCVASSGSLEH
jgi:hypothetical protein